MSNIYQELDYNKQYQVLASNVIVFGNNPSLIPMSIYNDYWNYNLTFPKLMADPLIMIAFVGCSFQNELTKKVRVSEAELITYRDIKGFENQILVESYLIAYVQKGEQFIFALEDARNHILIEQG
jgi:hypothetical protein